MSRFFVDGVLTVGDVVPIEGSDARKIVTVLRMSGGERIELIDSSGAAFKAEVNIELRRVMAVVREAVEPQAGASVRIAVAQAIPKAQKMDFVIEKLTELGVVRILPLHSERSVVTDVRENKLQRWKRLAKSAAAQCGRSDIPDIAAPLSLASAAGLFAGFDSVLFPWELAPRVPPLETLPALLDGAGTVLIVIGPEGGFSHEEAELARKAGAHQVWLGPRILRTETAALVAVSFVNLLLGG